MMMAGHHCTGQRRRATSLWCSTCVSRGVSRRRGTMMAGHHSIWLQTVATFLWYSTYAPWCDWRCLGMRVRGRLEVEGLYIMSFIVKI